MPEGRRSRSTEAFFGRRHGKSIRPVQARALAGYDGLGLDLGAPCPTDPYSLFRVPVDRARVEIGFGGGEHLHHEAERFPHVGFIGVEPFVNGMAKFLVQQAEEPRPNIRLYNDDATRLLDWLPAASVDGIDLLYPDPWPKRRHWKRRFVNETNLGRFARVMKPGAYFRFASDMDSYVNWTLERVLAHPAFAWEAHSADDWRQPYEGWPGTRYEAKAIRESRSPAYLTFRRL